MFVNILLFYQVFILISTICIAVAITFIFTSYTVFHIDLSGYERPLFVRMENLGNGLG